MRSTRLACGGAVAVASTLVALVLVSPAEAAVPASTGNRPNPRLVTLSLDYGGSIIGGNGKPAELRPLEPGIIQAALVDTTALDYERASDLGGFVPAPVGGFVDTVRVRLVHAGPVTNPQIPLFAKTGGKAGNAVQAFAFQGGATSSTTTTTAPRRTGPHRAGTSTSTSTTVPGAATTTSPAASTTTSVVRPAQGGASATTSSQPTGSQPTGSQPTGSGPGRSSTTTSSASPGGATTTTMSIGGSSGGASTTSSPAGAGSVTTTTTRASSSSTSTTSASPGSTTTSQPVAPPSETTTSTGSGTSSTTSSIPSTTTSTTTTTPSGSVEMTNSHDGHSFVNASNMAPGDSVSNTVTIGNVGSEGFDLTLEMSPSSNALAQALVLVITRYGAPDKVLYDQSLAAATSPLSIGYLAAGSSITFNFALELPRTAGNGLQDQSATLDLTWVGQK